MDELPHTRRWPWTALYLGALYRGAELWADVLVDTALSAVFLTCDCGRQIRLNSGRTKCFDCADTDVQPRNRGF